MGTRATRKLETEVALRRAAVRLMTERGYDATSTDDIARAAGVSPRTFFNYFPTKEEVVVLPENLLADVVGAALRRRPPGEDVVTSLAAAAMDSAANVEKLGDLTPDASLLPASLRLMFGERSVRAVFLERRAALEDVVWSILLERGVAGEDVGARAAVTTVVALAYLGLRLWAEDGAAEPLVAVVARCLMLGPEPARLAAGVTAAP